MWKVKPSNLVGISDEYLAYCLDEAIYHWGSFVQGKLDEIEAKNSKERKNKTAKVLGDLLKLPDSQRFKAFRPPSGG